MMGMPNKIFSMKMQRHISLVNYSSSVSLIVVSVFAGILLCSCSNNNPTNPAAMINAWRDSSGTSSAPENSSSVSNSNSSSTFVSSASSSSVLASSSNLVSSSTKAISSSVVLSSITASSSLTQSSSSATLSSAVVSSSSIATSSAGSSASTGISYGNVKDNAGKSYLTVTFDGQTWMAENMHYATTSGSWCKDDNSDAAMTSFNSTYCDTHGRVYDWATANTVCPSGWHLPTDAQWQTLEMYLGMTYLQADSVDWRGLDEGARLKMEWSGMPSLNTVGFAAVPAEVFSSSGGTFGNAGSVVSTVFWTSTNGTAGAYYRMLSDTENGIQRNVAGESEQKNGYSVRCLKD